MRPNQASRSTVSATPTTAIDQIATTSGTPRRGGSARAA